jgi:hypothetical protein
MIDVSRISTKSEARNLMHNAERLGRHDVYWQAFKRLCELEGASCDDPLHKGFYRVLAAYEELLTKKHGRTTKAARTRQKLASKGVERCLEDWALSSQATEGFTLLIEAGLPELTGEYLVIKYTERFPEHVVAAAKRRLAPHGDRQPHASFPRSGQKSPSTWSRL